MRLVLQEKVGSGLLVALMGIGLMGWPLRSRAALSAQEIVRRAVARSQPVPGTKEPAYSYTKVSVTEQLDSTGKVKERKEKVYHVWIRDGVTRAQLVQVNGRPPDAAELRKQAENDQNARQWLGQGRSGQGESRDRLLTPELAARFDYTLLDQSLVHGRAAYRIAFHPKVPPLPVRHLADRVLNRVSGTLWIDAQEFEVARAEINLGSEVDFLGGVIGSLKKLAFSVTRSRVADGLWLNISTNGDFEGRKLLDPLRVKTNSQVKDVKVLAMLGSGKRSGK